MILNQPVLNNLRTVGIGHCDPTREARFTKPTIVSAMCPAYIGKCIQIVSLHHDCGSDEKTLVIGSAV